MGFWFAFAFWIFATALEYILTPRPRPNAPQPSSRGQYQRPTAEEGRVVPYIAGTALINGPVVMWDGDYDATPIIEDGNTIGYRYYLGVQYGLCLGPVDRVIGMRFDDKDMPVATYTITPGLVLSILNGATRHEVGLPAGEYETGEDAAKAVSLAMQQQAGDSRLACCHGYQIVTGINDTIHAWVSRYFLGWASGWITVHLRAGQYTGAELAAEIEYQCQETYRFKTNGFWSSRSFSWLRCSYNDQTGVFTLSCAATAWQNYMYGRLHHGTFRSRVSVEPDSTALLPLGIDGFTVFHLGDGGSPYVPSVAGAPTAQDTFFFRVPSGCVIEWTRPETTCELLFGMTSAGPDFTESSRCDNPVASASEYASYSPFAGGVRVSINAPSLFGGEHQEGGIVGDIDVYLGGDDQLPDDYLEDQLGHTPPAYLGLCHAVARHLYHGNSPYLKDIGFILERIPNSLGLTGGMETILSGLGASGNDANPACVIYELLTDARWGLGYAPALVDAESFRLAGETLWSESLGFSLNVDSPADGLDLISDLLRHIDGVLYADPESGLLTLDLVRADYDPAALPVLDEDVVGNLTLSRPSWERLRNVVRIQYVDRSRRFTTRTVDAQDLAGIQMVGRQDVETLGFRAASTEATAALIATRTLRTLGYPLAQVEMDVNRRAWRMRPGAPFVLSYGPLGIERMICRATRVYSGTLAKNRIRVEAVEDPNGVDWSRFEGGV